VCTNAAPRARDGDPRFARVVLAGYTAADTPDPRCILAARATSRTPAVRATKVIVRGAYGGPHDRTATLSQIVHLSLRCMFEPDANFDRQRRPYAPILQPVCVVR